ncbi:MAG: TraR/DksA family transcriptional regulator [Gammaproteobacteria bacterium]
MEKFRRLLFDRRNELKILSGAGKASAEPVELDQTRIGRLSRMDAMQQQAMHQESHRRREMELKRIELALCRMDDGEYGHCMNCGQPIGEKRLVFDPAATLCIRCANHSEQ